MYKKLLPVIALATGFAWAIPGQAETITITVLDNGTLVGSSTSSTGTAAFAGSDANFSSIAVSSQGVPIVPDPDLSSNTLNATVSAGFSGPRVLTVNVVQTGLAAFTGNTSTTGTFNALIGAPGPVTENLITSAGTLVTETLSGPVSTFGPVANSVTGITSDEEQFLITFNAANQSAAASMQFLATAVVPEPASLTLLGSALIGLGWFSRRRRKSL